MTTIKEDIPHDFDSRVEVFRGYRFIEVRIDGIPHLLVDPEKVAGMQTWLYGDPPTRFALEFILTECEPGAAIAEYNIRGLWEAVARKVVDIMQVRRKSQGDMKNRSQQTNQNRPV